MTPSFWTKAVASLPTAAMLVLFLSLGIEPALANKFETISGGFSGTPTFKRDWLTWLLAISGGVSLFLGLLAVVMPHNNAAFLNYHNWKQSAILLFVAGGALLGAAVLV